MEEESTTDSTTYDIGNGKKLTEFYSQDVRFENEEGELVDYDASLTKVKEDTSDMGASLESYAYENTNFYDSSVTGFNVGKILQGASRAYLVFASLSALKSRPPAKPVVLILPLMS